MALTAYQAHMKRELKGKMKGKTAAQRKAIFKAAAKSYKKKGSSKPKARVSRATQVKSVARRVTSRKPTGGRSTVAKNGFNTQKIFKYLRLASLGVPILVGVSRYGFSLDAAKDAFRQYSGVNVNNGTFSWASLAQGWTPFVGTSLVTYGIPKLMKMIRSF